MFGLMLGSLTKTQAVNVGRYSQIGPAADPLLTRGFSSDQGMPNSKLSSGGFSLFKDSPAQYQSTSLIGEANNSGRNGYSNAPNLYDQVTSQYNYKPSQIGQAQGYDVKPIRNYQPQGGSQGLAQGRSLGYSQ